jgi:hypothetical protein
MARMGAGTSGHPSAATWDAVGLVTSLPPEVAANGIAGNAALPAGVNTNVIHNKAM